MPAIIGDLAYRACAAGVLALVLLLAPGAAFAAEDDLGAIAQSGTHVLMRHATAPGVGDPPGFVLTDCTTQRNLNEAGRLQARQVGERLRGLGVSFDVVLTSQWCRAAETARLLGLAPVQQAEELNSFFGEGQAAAGQTEALKRRLAALTMEGKRAVLVTHQVNITALTGVYPASGEVLVISTDSAGAVRVSGRMRTE